MKRLIEEKEEMINEFDDDHAILKNDLDSTLDCNRMLKEKNEELEVGLLILKFNGRFQ